ncbi:hypothetical protein GW17_00009217 [Ensete ventricosum]|nr:hypothetical protein GW17_00009217 [Ensete ventricosum]
MLRAPSATVHAAGKRVACRFSPATVKCGHATQFGWGIHYYPYHSLSPGRRLSRDFVKTRGRILRVRSCNKGVICMPVWGYATSAIGWLALAWLSGGCRASQGKPSGEQKVCLEILGTKRQMVPGQGRMSSASSHSESRSVEILARRSRVLSHPSRDSGSTIVVSLSGGATPVDPRVADALATMQSFFNVNSIVTTCQLKEGVKDMNEAWLTEVGLSPAPQGMFFLLVYHAGCFSDCTLSLAYDASGSTTKVLVEKGKEPVVTEEAPECGYTLRELCKVEDRAGVEKYFAIVMTRLKVAEGEAPMMSRWSTISELSQFWTKGPLSGEYLQGALHPALAKQVYECSSEELMNRAGKSTVWLESLKNQQRRLEEEVGVLHSSLDGAWNDRARLEGDVLSLTEAATLLEAELKVEGPRAVAVYKASRGFESGLEKMGRVNYEFGY